MRLFKLLFCVVALLLLASCNSRPDYVIDEETMTSLLTDVHMAEGLIEMQHKQAKEDAEYGQEVMAAVLLKYNLTKEQYDTSLVWYSQNLKSLIRIYKKVDKNLEEKSAYWTELADASNLFKGYEEGDSINLWRVMPHLILDERRLTNFRMWTLPVDSTFKVGDTIRWQMHIPNQHPGQGVVVSLSLLKQNLKNQPIELLDGVSTTLLTRDTLLTLSCASDTTAFDEVLATIHLLRLGGENGLLMPSLVNEIKMIRIHKK